MLELSDWTRHHGIGYARFVDLAGDVHTLDKAEAVNVVAAARSRTSTLFDDSAVSSFDAA